MFGLFKKQMPGDIRTDAMPTMATPAIVTSTGLAELSRPVQSHRSCLSRIARPRLQQLVQHLTSSSLLARWARSNAQRCAAMREIAERLDVAIDVIDSTLPSASAPFS